MNGISQDPISLAERHAAKLPALIAARADLEVRLRTQSARSDTVRAELATLTARMKAHGVEAERLDAEAAA